MSDGRRIPSRERQPHTARARETATPVRRQVTVWRVLVAAQLSLGALILLSLLVVYLMGLFGSLFAQHTL